MGWSVGYDYRWKRDIGYGVPAVCDDPSCDAEIDRGLAYCCGGEPFGGDKGCGLHFCSAHLWHPRDAQLCRRCKDYRKPYAPKPDTAEWIKHKLTDPTWEEWRQDNSRWVAEHSQGMEALVAETAGLGAKPDSPVGAADAPTPLPDSRSENTGGRGADR